MPNEQLRMTPEVPDPSERVMPKTLSYLSSSGAASPGWRGNSGSRPEQSQLDVSDGFAGLSFPAGGLPLPMDAGPPYAVKDGALRKLAWLYGVKLARHAHDRMEERTPLHSSHVDLIQRAVDTLGLPKGSYHLPLRDKGGSVIGYAQFKGVENRKAPVLATVLGPKMKPGGENIENRIKLSHEPETNATMDKPPTTPDAEGESAATPEYNGKFTTDTLDPRPPGSLASTRAATRVGSSQLPLADALRKAFNDLRMTETNTIDQGSTAPETGAEG